MYTHSPSPEVALKSLSLTFVNTDRTSWTQVRTRLSNLLLKNRVRNVKDRISRNDNLYWPRPPQHLTKADTAGEVLHTAAGWAEDAYPPWYSFQKSHRPSLTMRKAPDKARLEDIPQDTWAGHFFRLSWLWNSRKDLQTSTDQRRQDSNVVPWTGPQNRKRTLTGKSAKQKLSPQYR